MILSSSKTIDTLVPDIQELFNKGADISESSLETFKLAVAGNLKERFSEYSQGRLRTLRLSNIGKPLRQLWFEVKSGLEPEPLSADAKLKFLYGDIIEDLALLLAIEAGHKVEGLQQRVEVDGVSGHIDCLIDNWLVDVKSCSTRAFPKFKDGSLFANDSFGYCGQLAGYSRALGIIDAAWLAIDKTLGHMCLLKFPVDAQKAWDISKIISQDRVALSRPTPPSKLCYEPVPEGKSGNMKLGMECSYCGYKKHCHPGLRTFIYSRGPVYLTKVVRTPDVKEVTNSASSKYEEATEPVSAE